MPGVILNNMKAKVETGMLRYTKYGPDYEIPSVMTFKVVCKSQLAEERVEIFKSALADFEAALRTAGVAAMAKNKTRVKSDFEKLSNDCLKYVGGKNPINIVMDLIVADTDDGGAFEGSISVKINDKEKINIPLKVLLVIVPPGEGWTRDLSSIKRMENVEAEFSRLVKRENIFV